STSIGLDFEASLPANGTYSLVLDSASTTAINYSFRVFDITDPTVAASGLPLDLNGTITAGEVETFTFTAPAGQRIYFDSQDGDSDQISIGIVSPSNTSIVNTNLAPADPGTFLLTESGTYTVRIQGNSPTSTGDYRFRLLALPADATALTLGA